MPSPRYGANTPPTSKPYSGPTSVIASSSVIGTTLSDHQIAPACSPKKNPLVDTEREYQRSCAPTRCAVRL